MLDADPAFLDDRQDFLSSSFSGDLEDEQLMMMQQQQQQQQLRPHAPTSSSPSRPYQHQQHPLSPARSTASSASTASLVSQRSASTNKGTPAEKKLFHKRNNSNSSFDNIDLRMQVSFDEETELLQEELGYEFVAGKDVLSGRGQKVKVLNTHYRDLIRKFHPDYVAAGFGGKRRKLAECICNTIFQNGGRFLDFKGKAMTEQQCQQKIMKALKDFSKKGKSSSGSTAATPTITTSPSTTTTTSKSASTSTKATSMPNETNSNSSSGTGTTRSARRAAPAIVSPPQPKRITRPSSLNEIVAQQKQHQQLQRQPTPTPTSSVSSRPSSPTPSMLMLESDDDSDDMEGCPVEVSSSSSNGSVKGLGTNRYYYFDQPPPLTADVPAYEDKEDESAPPVFGPSSPSQQQQAHKTMSPPAPAIVDESQTRLKRQKMSHPPTPPSYYYHPQPQYQYPPYPFQYQQHHAYGPLPPPPQQHQHYQQPHQLPQFYNHPYAVLNREMINRVRNNALSSVAPPAPPAPPRRVTMTMASSSDITESSPPHRHHFRVPSPPLYQSQPARQGGSNGDNNNDIEPLELSDRDFALDDATVQEMLGGLVVPDDFL
jgi:hypothetical protein